jgi:hypothetical protein
VSCSGRGGWLFIGESGHRGAWRLGGVRNGRPVLMAVMAAINAGREERPWRLEFSCVEAACDCGWRRCHGLVPRKETRERE